MKIFEKICNFLVFYLAPAELRLRQKYELRHIPTLHHECFSEIKEIGLQIGMNMQTFVTVGGERLPLSPRSM